MEDESYRKAAQTGVSDGTHSGNRGVQENYRRQAAVAHEANKLGENIAKGIFALFVHPVFCFVGFWLLGFGLLIALAPMIGVSETASNAPSWYLAGAGGVPLVLAVMLRKYVRKIMIGVLITAGVVLAVMMVMKVKSIREERAARAEAPAVIAPAPRTPTPVEIQRALIDARAPETTSVPPSGATGSEFERVYCSGPPAERPAFCP